MNVVDVGVGVVLGAPKIVQPASSVTEWNRPLRLLLCDIVDDIGLPYAIINSIKSVFYHTCRKIIQLL